MIKATHLAVIDINLGKKRLVMAARFKIMVSIRFLKMMMMTKDYRHLG